MNAPIRSTCLLAFCILVAAGITYVATNDHAGGTGNSPITIAALVTLFGTIPPIWIGPILTNGAARQLFVVAWRLGALLPGVFLADHWEGPERKSYLIALVACYFVALPLESWLLIRDAKRKQ